MICPNAKVKWKYISPRPCKYSKIPEDLCISVQSCKSPRHWRYGCCKTRKNMTNMQKQKNMKGIQNICIIKNPVHPNHATQTFGIQKMLKVQSIDHAIWLESKIILASTIQDKCWWNHAKKVTAYPSNGHIIFIYNQKLEMLVKIHIQTSRKKLFFSLKTCKTFGDSRKPISRMFFLKKMHFFHFHAMFLFFSFTLLSIINKLLTCLVGPDFNIYEVNMKHGHRINNVYSFSHTMDVIAFEQFCNLFLTRT